MFEHQFWYDPHFGICYRSLKFLGFPGYRVGDDGSVSAFQSADVPGLGRVWKWARLRPGPGPSGHLRITLTAGSKRRRFLVHHLVLLAFVGPAPEGCVCRHFPDRDPKNNKITNIQWGTAEQNQKDRIAHGTDTGGPKAVNARFTADDIRAIRRDVAESIRTISEIAKETGCSRHGIRRIIKRQSYTRIQ